ncbi:hypothetical protein GCM10027321_44520 [Massilia terrae]|uniref:Transmembrane protein n=1 Tax=Massilia terrae TaxID=1811224 RepID=A0ABT2D0Y2_9BURK|nr:hypothetical protein [Massilia terrae]MCS0659018.1 hypothetical protein [Massilia terrae]
MMLRARILFARVGVIGVVSALLLIAGLAVIAWLEQVAKALEQRQELAVQSAALPKAVPKLDVPAGDDNTAQFYRALGERRYAGEQIKTMFALASKAGLVLSKGEYREAFDPNAKVWTYQVTLPVRGGYGAIWAFALQSLQAIPFASLDDIGFHRDAIGDPDVEARLRFTVYLRDRPAGEDR